MSLNRQHLTRMHALAALLLCACTANAVAISFLNVSFENPNCGGQGPARAAFAREIRINHFCETFNCTDSTSAEGSLLQVCDNDRAKTAANKALLTAGMDEPFWTITLWDDAGCRLSNVPAAAMSVSPRNRCYWVGPYYLKATESEVMVCAVPGCSEQCVTLKQGVCGGGLDGTYFMASYGLPSLRSEASSSISWSPLTFMVLALTILRLL